MKGCQSSLNQNLTAAASRLRADEINVDEAERRGGIQAFRPAAVYAEGKFPMHCANRSLCTTPQFPQSKQRARIVPECQTIPK
jgi:hypothetical protein